MYEEELADEPLIEIDPKYELEGIIHQAAEVRLVISRAEVMLASFDRAMISIQTQAERALGELGPKLPEGDKWTYKQTITGPGL